MSKNSCIAAEKHRKCVLRMARVNLYKKIEKEKIYHGEKTIENNRNCSA